MHRVAIILIGFLFLSPVIADGNHEHFLSEKEWTDLMERATMLDDVAYMPSLLPIIMANRDSLNLSDEQISQFKKWRRHNYINMLNLMNRIIQLRVDFSVESLSTNISNERLIASQKEIQQLQHELLMIRLSCRDIIMQTFTPEQWDNFSFIIEEHPRIASFYSLIPTSNSQP